MVNMNNTKSTPLSHLPSQGSISAPQQDIIPADDESTIQEVLNQLTGGGGSPPAGVAPQAPSPPPPPPQQQTAPALDASTTALLNSLMNSAGTVGGAVSGVTAAVPQASSSSDSSNSIANMVMLALTEDFKLASIIFAVYIATCFIPITKFLEKYFSLEKIPYSEIIIKAAIVAVLVIFAKKLLIK